MAARAKTATSTTKAWLTQILSNMQPSDLAADPKDRDGLEKILKHQKEAMIRRIRDNDNWLNLEGRETWTFERGHPPKTLDRLTAKEKTRIPLFIECKIDTEGTWTPPPEGVKLTDELVYLATKFLSAKARGKKYPIDFDGNGFIRSTRIPEDPAPIAWAFGLPFILIAIGGIPLVGKRHARKLGNLSSKTDSSIRDAKSMFTVGSVVASKSFVNMPRSVKRQFYTMDNDRKYPNENQNLINVDIIGKEHHHLVILLGDTQLGTASQIGRLVDVKGYRIQCGDPAEVEDGANVSAIPKSFFLQNEIEIDYKRAQWEPYHNESDPQFVKGKEPISSASGGEKTDAEGQPLGQSSGEEDDDDEPPTKMISRLSAYTQPPSVVVPEVSDPVVQQNTDGLCPRCRSNLQVPPRGQLDLLIQATLAIRELLSNMRPSK